MKPKKQCIPNKWYIIFDGTSHFAAYGCDVPNFLEDDDNELAGGPYSDSQIDAKVEELNDDCTDKYVF